MAAQSHFLREFLWLDFFGRRAVDAPRLMRIVARESSPSQMTLSRALLSPFFCRPFVAALCLISCSILITRPILFSTLHRQSLCECAVLNPDPDASEDEEDDQGVMLDTSSGVIITSEEELANATSEQATSHAYSFLPPACHAPHVFSHVSPRLLFRQLSMLERYEGMLGASGAQGRFDDADEAEAED